MYECTTNTKLNYVLYILLLWEWYMILLKINAILSLISILKQNNYPPAQQKPLKNIYDLIWIWDTIQLHFFSKINYTTNYYYSRPPRFHGKDTHTPQQQQQQIIIVYYNVWQNQEIKWLYQNQGCNFFFFWQKQQMYGEILIQTIRTWIEPWQNRQNLYNAIIG